MAVSCLERRPRPPSSRPRRTDVILGPYGISPLVTSASCWPTAAIARKSSYAVLARCVNDAERSLPARREGVEPPTF